MDTYEIVRRLAKGSFGTVHICQKRHNRQKMVIKQIPSQMIGDDLEKAENEVAILRSVDHPNVIEYYDSYIKRNMFYIVMEYASSGNLHEYIVDMRNKNTYNNMEPQTVMDFFCQILLGLDHIHNKGIFHRDLKCENIFVTGIDRNILKIGDFGISKLMSSNYFANTIVGTFNYVAPEICEGKAYNNKTDIWALGCILYELCQMEKMFDGSVTNIVLSIASGKLKRINGKYGKQMQELLNILLKVDPAQRPDTRTIMCLGDVFPSLNSLAANLGCIF